MTNDALIYLDYLLNKLHLDADRRVAIYFEDATGFIGFPAEVATYLAARFAIEPTGTYEVDRIPDDFTSVSFELTHVQNDGGSESE